jgi:hypothetical protein
MALAGSTRPRAFFKRAEMAPAPGPGRCGAGRRAYGGAAAQPPAGHDSRRHALSGAVARAHADEWLLAKELVHCHERVTDYGSTTAPRGRAARRADPVSDPDRYAVSLFDPGAGRLRWWRRALLSGTKTALQQTQTTWIS